MIGFNRGNMTSVSGGTRYVGNYSSDRDRSSFSAEIVSAYNPIYIENVRRPPEQRSSGSGAIVIGNPAPPGTIGSGLLYPSLTVSRDVVHIEVHPELLHGCTASDTPCDEDAEDACIICHERTATVALVPCGHMFTCIACTRGLAKKECPTCRAVVTSALKVFK